MLLEFDLNKNVAQNAEDYYARSKKVKKKIEGVENAIAKFKKELEQEIKKEVKKEAHKEVQKIELVKKWYHKFRWFFSSEGFLCIGGRDATTNDIVIKKHTDPTDIVFHTESPGSPFFVIKSEGKKIGEATIQETAIATGSFSRAWKQGVTNTEVFHVNPDQVSKEANTGEFLTKGAFMIYGKKNNIQVKLELAIGLKDNELMCGPIEAVKKYCTTYLIVNQGSQKPSDAAKKIKQSINAELDDIIRVLPAGDMHVEKN
ncbi:DUF814 domain-containing protein [Candidatus Woesearchaeota archaeon]|nr:DUF814 domain-containing protein [Candidatus Woesearchaeota archaeon]